MPNVAVKDSWDAVVSFATHSKRLLGLEYFKYM